MFCDIAMTLHLATGVWKYVSGGEVSKMGVKRKDVSTCTNRLSMADLPTPANPVEILDWGHDCL